MRDRNGKFMNRTGLLLAILSIGVSSDSAQIPRGNDSRVGLLTLVAANGAGAQKTDVHPHTLESLLQQMREKPSQWKQSDIGKDAPSAPLFLEAPQYPTGIAPQSVAVGDFNGDNKADLAVVNFCTDDACGQSSVSVLLGNGDGTFQKHVDYPTGTGSVSIVVADLNHDGRPDLAVTNICSDPSCVASSVSILLGKGDGTFQAHVDYATGPGALGAAVGDLNGDGKADLVTADYFDAVSVLLGKGDGTFQTHVDNFLSCLPDSNLCAPETVAIADFNGDHKLDLAAADYFGMRVSIFLGNGDGTFQPQSDQLKFLLSNPSMIAAADLNGDGNIDLVVNDQSNNIADAIAVLPGKGDGTFTQKLGYRTGVIGGGDTPCSIAIADFNGDQKLDIANCNDGGNSVTVVLGNGDETFSYTRAWGTGDAPRGIAVGDFNGDGKEDIAATNQLDNTVSVLLGNGDGTFYSRPDADWFAGVIPAVADFNGDGKVDLLTSGGVYNTLSLMLGKGDGTFEPRVDFEPGTGPGVTGDFNHDGKPDFAVVVPCDSSCISSFVRVYIGNGDGTFKPHVDYAVPFTANFLAAADFNSDGQLDLAVTFSTIPPNHGLRILLGNGDGTFSNFGDLTLEAVGNVVTADFNGDGKTDLATADEWNSSFNILLGNGDGTFQAPVNYMVPPGLAVLAVGDINGDNKPDLIAGSDPALSVGLVSVYLGNGDGTFKPPVEYDPGTPVLSLAVADFDGDHHVDLAVGGLNNPFVNILRGNGDGTFNSPLAYTVGGAPGGLAVADFNADGKPDLAAPNYSYTASVLLNIANIPMFTLSAGINGSGSVRIDPGGTLCSANCSKSFATGTAIILTATADSGSSFSGWSGGGCSGTGTCSVTLTSDQTITATFLTPEFSLSASDPAPNPISSGQSSMATINAAALGGFSGAVSLICSVQPSPAHAPQCSLNPNSITPGTPATLTIATTAPTAAQALPFANPSRPFNALWLPIAGLALAGISFGSPRGKKTKLASFLLCSLLVAGLVFQAACGGGGGGNGGGGGTPPDSYTITITGKSGSLNHSTTVRLKVQ
jgi:hypothetical protein